MKGYAMGLERVQHSRRRFLRAFMSTKEVMRGRAAPANQEPSRS